MPNQHLDKDNPLSGKMMGGWSKFGGSSYGLKQGVSETWYCQICATETPRELPPFNFEIYPGEFIRVCNICLHKLDQIKANPIVRIRRVIKISRKAD